MSPRERWRECRLSVTLDLTYLVWEFESTDPKYRFSRLEIASITQIISLDDSPIVQVLIPDRVVYFRRGITTEHSKFFRAVSDMIVQKRFDSSRTIHTSLFSSALHSTSSSATSVHEEINEEESLDQHEPRLTEQIRALSTFRAHLQRGFIVEKVSDTIHDHLLA